MKKILLMMFFLFIFSLKNVYADDSYTVPLYQCNTGQAWARYANSISPTANEYLVSPTLYYDFQSTGLDICAITISNDSSQTPNRARFPLFQYFSELSNKTRVVNLSLTTPKSFSLPVVSMGSRTCSLQKSRNLSDLQDFYDVTCYYTKNDADASPFLYVSVDPRDSTGWYPFGYGYIGFSRSYSITNNSSTILIDSILNNSNLSLEEQKKTTDEIIKMQEKQDEMKKEQEKTNSILTDDNVNSDGISGLADISPAGPLDSLISLPILLLNNINNALSSTSCSPLTFPIPFVNQQATIPCFSDTISSLGFSSMFNTIGSLVGGLVIFTYLKFLYKRVNNYLNLRENNSDWGD